MGLTTRRRGPSIPWLGVEKTILGLGHATVQHCNGSMYGTTATSRTLHPEMPRVPKLDGSWIPPLTPPFDTCSVMSMPVY
jgi:hypothetical protein